MGAENYLHLDTSSNRTALCGSSTVRTRAADSQTACSKVEGGIFEMDDVVEAGTTDHDKPSLSPPVSSVSGKKRRLMDEEPSVRIIYSSLTRNSKRKLQELLNIWSEWHTQNSSSVQNLTEEASEFGEETYYPALHVAAEGSTVSFCLDNQIRKKQCTESLSVKNECVPVYDRDYAVGLNPSEESADPNKILNIREASRCFNCGSYNHSLQDCPKPRDTVSISNARKEFQSKKNKRSVPHVHTRYFQSSPSGKYDGLKPGCLAAETREALGLGELDPPPWLHRMRQLGYPSGYLDPEDEDQPSGLKIYGDEETGNANTNNVKSNITGSRMKKSVDFPGINALIPEYADQKKWDPLHVQVDCSESAPRAFNSNTIFQSPVVSPNTLSWKQNYARAPSPRHSNWSSPSRSGYLINRYAASASYSHQWSSPPIPTHHINHYDSSPTFSNRYFSPMSISIPSRRDYWRPPPHAGLPFSPPSCSLPNSEPPPPGAEVRQNPWPFLIPSGISFPSL